MRLIRRLRIKTAIWKPCIAEIYLSMRALRMISERTRIASSAMCFQSNETHEALEAATNGSRPDARFTLADLDAKAATALKIRFDLGLFDPITEPGICNSSLPSSNLTPLLDLCTFTA